MTNLEEVIKCGLGPARVLKSPVRLRFLGLTLIVLTVAFNRPLLELVRYSQKDELYSHVVLMPLISAYLVWNRRRELISGSDMKVGSGWLMGMAGLLALAGYILGLSAGWTPQQTDALSILVFAFVCMVNASCFLAAGKANAPKLVFPLGLLFLMVPLPTGIEKLITSFLQVASADVSYVLLKLTGTPILRDGLVFILPGLPIAVAEECSGIRSTLVLFITSLLAGHLFLRSPWRKWVLALAIVPIGIIRNGFRIAVISSTTAYVDRAIIDLPPHHKGVPLFFVLS